MYGPKQCESGLRKRLELSGTLEDFPNDPTVTGEAVPGNKLGEATVMVRSAGGTRTTLLFADVIQNNPQDIKFLFRTELTVERDFYPTGSAPSCPG